jgi:hypothetical protein
MIRPQQISKQTKKSKEKPRLLGANPGSSTMSSLLRSPAIRRALSAASSGGPQGGSSLRAPSAAAPAAAGEGGATVRRGLGLPTVPRRHLSGQERNGKPPALSTDQVKKIP